MTKREDVFVPMAAVRLAEGGQRLVIYGLGSCVALALWNAQTKRGGLAHVMLPTPSSHHVDSKAPAKYASHAVHFLWEKLGGASQTGALIAKMTGGANLFPGLKTTGLPIGLRNVLSVREELERLGVSLAAEDIGGRRGRTVFFYPEDGRMEIRRFQEPTRWL